MFLALPFLVQACLRC